MKSTSKPAVLRAETSEEIDRNSDLSLLNQFNWANQPLNWINLIKLFYNISKISNRKIDFLWLVCSVVCLFVLFSQQQSVYGLGRSRILQLSTYLPRIMRTISVSELFVLNIKCNAIVDVYAVCNCCDAFACLDAHDMNNALQKAKHANKGQALLPLKHTESRGPNRAQSPLKLWGLSFILLKKGRAIFPFSILRVEALTKRYLLSTLRIELYSPQKGRAIFPFLIPRVEALTGCHLLSTPRIELYSPQRVELYPPS